MNYEEKEILVMILSFFPEKLGMYLPFTALDNTNERHRFEWWAYRELSFVHINLKLTM